MANRGIGGAVIYTDTVGIDHDAIITNCWGPNGEAMPQSAINVVWVSGDTSRTDTYGRQVERECSVSHQTMTNAHGRFWRFPGEAKETRGAPFNQPVQAQV